MQSDVEAHSLHVDYTDWQISDILLRRCLECVGASVSVVYIAICVCVCVC